MTALIIISVICLIILAILFLRIKFDIISKEETLVYLNILGIKKQLFPSPQKKAKIKRFKKGYPKEKEKPDKERDVAQPKKDAQEEKIPLGEKISSIVSLVKLLLSRFFKHLRLDVSNIYIKVGGKDAANCAISYGIISQATAYLLEFLDKNLNIHKKRKGRIDVLCDFTAEKIEYDIFISASLNVWQILDIAISLVYNYFKGKDIFGIKKHLYGGEKQNGRKQNQ